MGTKLGVRVVILLLVVGLVGGGVHVLFNPIGMHRLEGVEARLRQGLKEVRPGVGLAEIRQFCVREGLEMGEPSEEFWHPGDPPEGAKWEVRGMHPYEAHYYGGSAGMLVDFWLDRDQKLIRADIGTHGSAF